MCAIFGLIDYEHICFFSYVLLNAKKVETLIIYYPIISSADV